MAAGLKLVSPCETRVIYRAAGDDERKRGVLVASRRDGTLVKNPACTVTNEAHPCWTGRATRFGLTPCDRTAIECECFAPEENSALRIASDSTRSRNWWPAVRRQQQP